MFLRLPRIFLFPLVSHRCDSLFILVVSWRVLLHVYEHTAKGRALTQYQLRLVRAFNFSPVLHMFFLFVCFEKSFFFFFSLPSVVVSRALPSTTVHTLTGSCSGRPNRFPEIPLFSLSQPCQQARVSGRKERRVVAKRPAGGRRVQCQQSPRARVWPTCVARGSLPPSAVRGAARDRTRASRRPASEVRPRPVISLLMRPASPPRRTQ